MALFLGIDGGGSKTVCVLADRESVLASATAEGSNIVRVGEARARRSLAKAIQEACAQAGARASEVCRTCVGVAGAADARVAADVGSMIRAMVGGEIEVVGDMAIALQAAFGEAPGVIVVAGTGSIAYGRNANGLTARAGGWGYEVSDEGSAHWIGRAAVSAVLRAHDEDIGTALQLAVFEQWQIGGIPELVRKANQAADFAALFPAVLQASFAGDGVARALLQAAGAELSRLAAVVLRKLGTRDAPLDGLRVALAGGVLEHAQLTRESFMARLRAECPKVKLREGIVQPVMGAVELARRASARGSSKAG